MNCRPVLRVALLVFGLLAFPARAASGRLPPNLPAAHPALTLMANLGCANCHTDWRLPDTLRNQTPDLGDAGSRFQAAYLFEFLQNPTKVRRHLGPARMPDFHLSATEAVALAAFLAEQRQRSTEGPPWPPELATASAAPPRTATPQQVRAELSTGLACLSCHTFDGQGGTQAVDLASVSYRLQPEWVKQFLVSPSNFGVPTGLMPSQFYQLARDGKRLEPMLPDAAVRLQRLGDQLFALNAVPRAEMEQRFQLARAAHPEAGAALGEKLFRALNCAACHRHPTIPPREQAGPDLTREALRVNPAWLQSYLKHPVPIRPFGYRPGEGSRMPDFRLSDAEAAALGEFLLAPREGAWSLPLDFRPRPLSAFSKAKAKSLLEQKLSCLGCHRLGDVGGRIGPELTAVRARLRPEYVHGIIKAPRLVAPHAIMPRLPLTDEVADLLSNFLLQLEATNSPSMYLSAADNALIPFGTSPSDGSMSASPRQIYLSHCAVCHGAEGGGDGFNARFLPVKPTVHADASHLAQRADDTLYDGIYSGGYILNKSPLMPAWGGVLSPVEIQGLVGFLRTLCRCQGPAWSRDNGGVR